MVRLSRREFEELVRRALESLPLEFRERLENVDVVVERRPSPSLLREMEMDPERETLFGLYQGSPLTERSTEEVLRFPDKISIFMEPLLRGCEGEEDLLEEVRRTVIHEIAHYFGLDDGRLEELGWD